MANRDMYATPGSRDFRNSATTTSSTAATTTLTSTTAVTSGHQQPIGSELLNGPSSGRDTYGRTAATTRTSRRDQAQLGGTRGTTDYSDRSPTRGYAPPTSSYSRPTSTRGSPAGGLRRRGGPGASGGLSRSYAASPTGGYTDDYRSGSHVPQSISTSAFTVGGPYRGDDPTALTTTTNVTGLTNMDRMDRTGMGTMDRSGVGMGGGLGGMPDHHRSTSMPASAAGPMHGRSRSASRGMPPNRGGPG